MYADILDKLNKLADPKDKKGMERYGINTDNALGISIYKLRALIKKIPKNHGLSIELWNSGIHEARILASMVDLPGEVTEAQMESWVKDFDSWDVCDLVCSNLFDKTKFAYKKAFEWSSRYEEYIKRAGFVMMAALSVHDKKADNSKFTQFFPIIIRESTDKRKYVIKAVNWALRQIGKRNNALNKQAMETANKIKKIESGAARWIAADAIRELKSEKVQKRTKHL